MKDANPKSLHEVVSKFRTNRETYDFYLPLNTIFSCFIFLRLLIHKYRNNLPDLLRNIELDWEQIQLNDPDSLLIIKGHLKSIPPALEKLSENNDGFFSDNLIQAISVTGELIKQCFIKVNQQGGKSLQALTDVAKWVIDQPLETSSQQRNLLKEFDESFNPLSANASRRNTGEYTTPKSISRLMVAFAELHAGGNKVYDPCFGSGYLLTAFCELGKKIPFGNEIKTESFIIGFTRLLLSGVDDPQLKLGDALNSELTQNDSFDVVLANPPWGARYKGPKDLFPIPTADTAGLFLQHALSKLRDKGLAVLVLPEGFFYKNSDRALRKALVNNHDVKAIISLPANSIHYTSIKPNILVVSKGGSTQKIRMINSESFFEINKNDNHFNISEKNLSRLLKHIHKQEESMSSWDMRIDEIVEREWDLTPKPPNKLLSMLVQSMHQEGGDEIPCKKSSLGECCEIMSGRHIKPSDLVDKVPEKVNIKVEFNPLDIPDSTNVLSVSAAETIHLIEKYLVHSCPDTYSYEKTGFITFRLPPRGVMSTIYKIDKILQITEDMKKVLASDEGNKLSFIPQVTSVHDHFGNEASALINKKDFSQVLDQKEIERLRNYLKGSPFPKNDRFYLLSKWKKLPNEFIPEEYKNEPRYPTIGQLLNAYTIETPISFLDETISLPNDILYIRTKDIQQNKFISSSTYLTPEASASIKHKWKLKAGDVLLSKSGTIGKTVIVTAAIVYKDKIVDALASSGLFVLRVNREIINPDYLHAYLQSGLVTQWLEDNARGATIQHLSKSMLEKLPIPIPSLDTQAEILDAPVPAEIADMTDPNKKDIWDVLPGFFKKPTKVSACDYLSAWIGIKIKKLKKIDRDSNDLLQFNYLMELAHSTKAAKNKVLNLWSLEEETGIDGDSLQDWIIGLEEHLNDLNGISKIPQGPALMNVLAMTASNLESLNQYCILESGEENGPVLLGGFWEYPDERYQDASALTSRLINILNMAIAVLCEEVKVSFEHKQSSVTPRGETVKCEITVRNQGIMPVRSLRVSSRVNELGGDPNSDLDWGEKNCSYLPEKGKDILHFEGKRPIIKGDITLSLFWKALLLNGTLTEGFQQVPLRLGMVEDSFKLQGQVIQEKLPFNKSPTVISKEISELSGSPYVAGDPVGNKEDVFFGRETLIDSIRRQVIKSGNVILLEGNRRTGKTSILQYLEGSTSIPGWLSIYCTLHNAKGSPDAVGVPTEEVFREMALCIAKGIVFGMKLECPLPNNKTQPPGEILGIAKACREGIGKEAPFADFREYLETILEVLQQKNLGLLLMTDEFDKLQEGIDNKVTSPQVPENIRALIHQYPRFSAILTGSRRLKKMRQEYWSALFGLGTRESVSSLEPDAAVKLITEPVKGQLSFSNDAVEKICLLTARQPYLTQCICTRIFDLAARENNRSITLDFVDRASDVLIKNNEHFASLWDYARSDRRRFLLALLQKESENRDPLRLGIIQEKLLSNGIEVGDDLLSEDLEHLQELELIKLIGEDQDGQYKLEVPLMGYWIQKQQDFSMLQKKAISETEDQG